VKTTAPVPLPVMLYRSAQRQIERKPVTPETAPPTKTPPPRNSVTAGRTIDLIT